MKTGLDFLTMLGTTEVLINKTTNEQQPRVVYFASYWGKWLLMITTGFCSVTFDRVDDIIYYMAESVSAIRLVNFRSVTCYTDQNFKKNVHFGALNLFTSEKRLK